MLLRACTNFHVIPWIYILQWIFHTIHCLKPSLITSEMAKICINCFFFWSNFVICAPPSSDQQLVQCMRDGTCLPVYRHGLQENAVLPNPFVCNRFEEELWQLHICLCFFLDSPPANHLNSSPTALQWYNMEAYNCPVHNGLELANKWPVCQWV